MNKLKTKTCKMPKCKKEIYDSKALFCGEHEREVREFRRKAGITAGTLLAVSVAIVTKRWRK